MLGNFDGVLYGQKLANPALMRIGLNIVRQTGRGAHGLMTLDRDAFPLLPTNQLEMGDVVRYLTTLNGEGHGVFRDSRQEEVFYVQIDESYRIRISVSGGRSQVQLHYLDNIQAYLDVSSLHALERAVGDLVAKIPGMTWPFRPTKGRVSATTPATNFRTISQLVGASQVEAVFDPYLTNSGLENLRVILSFGDGTVANGVRLLGSAETTAGSVPRFNKAGVDAWLLQLGISGEARAVAAKSEHRRFLLLSGGQSLLLGHSLNSVHKNEAVRVESNAEDRPFFDATWAAATVVP